MPLTFHLIPFQSSRIAIGYAVGAARILDHVIKTGSDGLDAAVQQLRDPKRTNPLDSDEEVAAAIEKGKAASGKSHSVATKEFGLACGVLLSDAAEPLYCGHLGDLVKCPV